MQDVGHKAGALAGGNQGIEGIGADGALEHHKALAGQVFQTDGFAPGKGMAFRQHHGQLLAAQGVQADGAVPRDFQAGEGKVNFARLQQRLGVAAVDFAHPHGERGIVPVDVFDERRHHFQQRHGNRADVQDAAVAGSDFLHGGLQPLHLLGKFAHSG